MKVVVISRVIYPANAPRPVRATELAKEFARQGHDVSLYALLGKYDYESFEIDTNIKVKSLGKTYFSRFNSDSSHAYSFLERLLNKLLRRWIEFPDLELSRNVFNVLKKEHDIDLLITIAVPFPIHWGAALFRTLHRKKLQHTTWVADCGDPYMGNVFGKHAFYFKYIEKWFCKKADFLTIPIKEAIEAYYPECREKIRVIPQGFRFDEVILKDSFEPNPQPTFIYAGVFYPGIRDPRNLLDFLVNIDMDFKFIIYTRSAKLIEPYKEKLKNKLIIKSYIPRIELLEKMSKADFLLNIENNTSRQSPSKLIDYALSKRPILSIGSNLDKKIVNQFLQGNYSQALSIENLEQYNISNVVKEFIKLRKEHIS